MFFTEITVKFEAKVILQVYMEKVNKRVLLILQPDQFEKKMPKLPEINFV